MVPTSNNMAPGVAAPEAQAPTSEVAGILANNLETASPWKWPTELFEAKVAYLRACESVWLRSLAAGPCSLAEARQAFSLFPPQGVDGRSAGGVAIKLKRQGRIRWVRWDRSPMKTHHFGAAGVWELSP